MSEAVVTDLYEATMTLSYLRQGMTAPATFSLFVRELPPQRGFLVAAGIADAVDYLTRWHIDDTDVDGFATALRRPRRQVEPLVGMRFTGDVWSVSDGRIVLAGEPLLEVTAPLPQAQLVETYLLNQVTHQTVIAAKAARCVLAAHGRPVVDFSLRRAHSTAAGMHAARAGAMVGFIATSNVAASAAMALGIPATGTMAHSYIEAFGDTLAAARDRFRRDLAQVPEPARRIHHPVAPQVHASTGLHRLTNQLRARLAPTPFDGSDKPPQLHMKCFVGPADRAHREG